MLESTPSPEAGKRLRAERLRARLSTRAVQRLSQQIAQEKDNNQDYYISHGWLTEVENGKFTPSIYKLYTLSLIYKCNILKIMGFFGIDPVDAASEQRLVGLPHTHLIGSDLELPGQTIVLPVELRKNVELTRTNLVSRMFETWGQIPVALLQQLDLRRCLCGYIGLEDYTLYPLIRPGSFVEIDEQAAQHGCHYAARQRHHHGSSSTSPNLSGRLERVVLACNLQVRQMSDRCISRS